MEQARDFALTDSVIDEDVEAQGYDPATGAPVDVGSNWLGKPAVDPEDLGTGGDAIELAIEPEDREDNGQAGPTQENGGLGLGDEEGLGRSGLTEAGVIGSRDHDTGGSLDRVTQRANGVDVDFEQPGWTEDAYARDRELDRDQLDTMIPPLYAEPNQLDRERSGFDD